jgi:hypothetical protein
VTRRRVLARSLLARLDSAVLANVGRLEIEVYRTVTRALAPSATTNPRDTAAKPIGVKSYELVG